MMKSILCVVVALAGMLNAQELLPELAAPAAKHKAADEALNKQKLEAIALAAKSYVSALDSVEKAATAKGELDQVAAVVKEREDAASGTLEPSLPAALPKTKLQMSRKSLLASVERITADFAKRKKMADADYLRVLAALQTKAASNPELAKQLAAEKAALLDNGSAGAESGGATKVARISRGKNVIENGDFEKIVDGKPEGWKEGECVTVETENKNTYIRFDLKAVNNDGTTELHKLSQEIDIPKGAKTVMVSAKLRTKDCISLSKLNPRTPTVAVCFLNQEGKPFFYIYACWNNKNNPWKTFQSSGAIPKDTIKAYVSVSNGRCPGQIDFDDIEVTFK